MNKIKNNEDLKTFLDKKDYSETSKKTFYNKLNIIKNNYFPKKDYSFIYDYYEDLIKKIEEDKKYSPASKSSYYFVLNLITEIKEYKNKLEQYKKLVSDNSKKNELSKDKDLYISWNHLRGLYNNMKEETKEEITNKLLVALYVLQPPLRNDYINLKLFYKKPNEKEDKENNYLIIRKKNIVFVLNHYKTSKTFGQQKYLYKIRTEIHRILTKYLETFDLRSEKPENYLFPYNDKQMSQKIQNIFIKLINKPITINDLRKIYETALVNSNSYKSMTLAQKEKEHAKLLHSFITAHTNYNKPILVKFD
jgi:hypothetical protein